MKAKHTPGPWFVKYFSDSKTHFQVRQDFTSALIAELNTGKGDGSMEANARLIAAAPELLEALELLKQWAGELPGHVVRTIPDKTFKAVNAAIAKATGTTLSPVS